MDFDCKNSDKLKVEISKKHKNFMRSYCAFGPGVATVNIQKDNRLTRDEQLASCLHELGHIVARFLDMPGNNYPLSMHNRYAFSSNPEYREKIMKSEEEAWDVAEKTFHILKKFCLDGYRTQEYRSMRIEDVDKKYFETKNNELKIAE